jgi:hypothetical protein
MNRGEIHQGGQVRFTLKWQAFHPDEMVENFIGQASRAGTDYQYLNPTAVFKTALL